MKSRSGIALLTTLVLSLIALAFTGALLYMLTSGTRMSGVERRYTTALDAAKGASDYVIQQILDDSLNCTPNCDTPNAAINLGSYSNLGGYSITATLLSKTNVTGGVIYAVEVNATNSTTSEKAIIDFVYKVE